MAPRIQISRSAWINGLGASAMLWILIFWAMHAAFGADRTARVSHHKAERCLQTGKNPYPGQTLKVDKTCKSGMRWVYGE
jgi:hypothetical protein